MNDARHRLTLAEPLFADTPDTPDTDVADLSRMPGTWVSDMPDVPDIPNGIRDLFRVRLVRTDPEARRRATKEFSTLIFPAYKLKFPNRKSVPTCS